MDTKEDSKSCDSCDEEKGSAGDTGNPEVGMDTGKAPEANQESGSSHAGNKEDNPGSQDAGEANKGDASGSECADQGAKEANPGSQSVGEGAAGVQSGPVPGQMPFPYGYWQAPNLYPGLYMGQAGYPQGLMPGYWMPPGYGAFPPYMQPGQGVQQPGGWPAQGGADPGNGGGQQPQGQAGGFVQTANPGGSGMQNTPVGGGAQANPGQVQQHDAPASIGAGDSNNSSQGVADSGGANDGDGHDSGGHDGGHGCGCGGHHKEPNHDELKYGTYLDTPGHGVPEDVPAMQENISAPSGLASFFQLDNDSFWKGILVGSLATVLLTNSTVKKGIMKTVIKASASVKGGVEELKEQLADAEAEVLHELNQKKK
ncbi:MAG: hypothetical protein IMF13_06735 [Proteobacteria bacterium]|nr:hypothetical protein [Pseudomonadota bacterium]